MFDAYTMKRALKIILWRMAVAVGILGVGLSANAKVPIVYLRDLVVQADCIVTGDVIEVKEGGTSTEYKMPSKIAVIRTITKIKGAPGTEVSVRFVPSLSEEPSFSLGKSYVLFLKKSPIGVQVVVGFLGVREIVDGQVSTEEIQGEPKVQGIDQFVEKIGALEKTRIQGSN